MLVQVVTSSKNNGLVLWGFFRSYVNKSESDQFSIIFIVFFATVVLLTNFFLKKILFGKNNITFENNITFAHFLSLVT